MKKIHELQLRPTIMLNSSSCNLACKYCYCSRRKKQDMMDEKVLETLLKKFIVSYPGFISFCWHGGEPLFGRDISFFEKICEIQKKYQVFGQKIENRIQTNCTLINEDWANFFQKNNFKVGISVDGPQFINDAHRIKKNNSGSFEEIMSGISFLHEKKINFSVIAVISKISIKYPKEFFDFVTLQKFNTVSLNPCFGSSNLSVSAREYGYFLKDIFNLWIESENSDISFNPLEDIMTWFLGGLPRVCHFRGSCYRHVKIDSNGDVKPCDDFLGEDFKFGNILEDELDDLVKKDEYLNFFNSVSIKNTFCKRCKWFSLCTGGCSRYSLNEKFEKRKNDMCESRKIIFEHIERELKRKAYI